MLLEMTLKKKQIILTLPTVLLQTQLRNLLILKIVIILRGTWQDPADADFDHVMVYQNDTFLHNITAGVETDVWAGLSQNLSYNFSTRTVDTSGNVDTDWVNHTVSTDTCVYAPVADFVGTPSTLVSARSSCFQRIPRPIHQQHGSGTLGMARGISPVRTRLICSTQPGYLILVLKVGNAAGDNTTQKEDYINVTDCTVPATASFTSNVTCGIIPFAVNFTDTSTGGNITNWSWMFGDGNTSYAVNPENLYITAGLYTVNHSVTNSIGTSWSNITNYMTARFPGDTCASGVATGNPYDTDKYVGSWFTSWLI